MKSRFFLPLPGLASPPHSHSQQLPEPFPSGVPRWQPRRQPRRQPRGEPRRVAHRHCQPGRWRRGRWRPRRRRRAAARPLQPAPEGVFRPQDSGLDLLGGRRGRRPPEGVRGKEVPPRRGGGRRRGLVFVTPSPSNRLFSLQAAKDCTRTSTPPLVHLPSPSKYERLCITGCLLLTTLPRNRTLTKKAPLKGTHHPQSS